MQYVFIDGKRIGFDTVGKRMPKGYLRISRKCKLFELARARLGSQWECAVYYHIAVCAVAKGKPPGKIGRGSNNWTVDHIDNDCLNNKPSNLRWMRNSENTAKGNSNRN